MLVYIHMCTHACFTYKDTKGEWQKVKMAKSRDDEKGNKRTWQKGRKAER